MLLAPYMLISPGKDDHRQKVGDCDTMRKAIFGNLDKPSKHLAPQRLAVTEAVFGVLLAALAIQLMLGNLSDFEITQMMSH